MEVSSFNERGLFVKEESVEESQQLPILMSFVGIRQRPDFKMQGDHQQEFLRGINTVSFSLLNFVIIVSTYKIRTTRPDPGDDWVLGRPPELYSFTSLQAERSCDMSL